MWIAVLRFLIFGSILCWMIYAIRAGAERRAEELIIVLVKEGRLRQRGTCAYRGTVLNEEPSMS